MRVFLDSSFPPEDSYRHNYDWDQFLEDERTENLDFYHGVKFDVQRLDKNKINVYACSEHPGIFYLGRRRGQSVPMQLTLEEHFDHLISHNQQVAHGRDGYKFAPYPYDLDFVYSQMGIEDIDLVEKDVDVFMCGTMPTQQQNYIGDIHPLRPWYDVMQDFSHVFACYDSRRLFMTWHDKQIALSKSKISIVWSVFFGGDDLCRDYANENFPWIKFEKGREITRWLTPQFKVRTFEAAACKSIMLCYKDPFAGRKDYYRNSIEHYFEPGVDFIYFEDAADLREKIEEILGDYDNEKYKNMVNSAHKKLKERYDVKVFYEKFLVPLAEKGKTR